MDLTTTLSGLTGTSTNMNEIGLAILGLAVVAVTFKWVKAMFFG